VVLDNMISVDVKFIDTVKISTFKEWQFLSMREHLKASCSTGANF
jgi:hypothetical protein